MISDPVASTEQPQAMNRNLSFWALAGIALGMGFLFFRVVQPFLMPLVFSAVLAILLRPWYDRLTHRLKGHRRIAAATITILVVVLCLLPVSVALFLAGRELVNIGSELADQEWDQHPLVVGTRGWLKHYVSDDNWNAIRESGSGSLQELITGIYDRTQLLISNVVEAVVGITIASLGLYYFLADGPQIMISVRRLSPLESVEEETLIREFGLVCRGIIWATVVCSLFQALAAGIGFALVGIQNVWLLAVLTMFTSMVPFVGAAAVWLAAAIYLLLTGSYVSGIILIVYGSVVVSSLDNLLRAHVLHDSAHLHPLIALVSVLGALQFVGLWGIIAGPIVASIFYAVLKILRDRNWNSSAPTNLAGEQPLC